MNTAIQPQLLTTGQRNFMLVIQEKLKAVKNDDKLFVMQMVQGNNMDEREANRLLQNFKRVKHLL